MALASDTSIDFLDDTNGRRYIEDTYESIKSVRSGLSSGTIDYSV